jgi:hypothetical protein
MEQRAFVLIPLRDVMPDMNRVIPEDGGVRYFCEMDLPWSLSIPDPPDDKIPTEGKVEDI